MQSFRTSTTTTHDMIGHDHDYELCHEGINTHSICHDSKDRLSKDEWWYLVNTLDSWRVFNPRAVIKKHPTLAWKCMTLCKDNNVRIPGAYFTRCFKNELFKLEIKQELKNKLA